MVATVTIKSANNLKYEGVTPIIAKTENNANVIDITSGVASKTAELAIDQILGAVELCDVVLDTKAKNDAFHNVLNDYTIVITISEVA